MTAEEIRALDGPALTVLAHQLGLAPAWITPESFGDGKAGTWGPHLRLSQADAVFRQLRTRGWSTGNRWYAYREPPNGEVHAEKAHSTLSVFGVYGGPGQHAEAMALLLCAVLAVASTS